MAKTWRIDVLYDGSRFRVETPDPIRLGPGDAVEWYFLGLPNTFGPFLAFDDPDDDSPLGPFTSVIVRRSRVIAQGNTGNTDTNPFVYRVSAFGANGGRLEADATGSLENGVTDRLVPAEIDVTVTEGPDGAPLLEVSQGEVPLRVGGTVTWNFKGIDRFCEQPWVPEILFDPASGGQRPSNHYFGPFLSYTLLDVLEEGPAGERQRVMKVVGSGNNGLIGQYKYTAAVVAVRDGQRLFISSPDPVIDNDGELTVLP